MQLADLLNALKYGNEISDPAKWKRGQMLSNAVGGLLVLFLNIAMPDQAVSEELLANLTDTIVGILVCLNLIATKMTSKKV